jgi:hypothetical protein
VQGIDRYPAAPQAFSEFVLNEAGRIITLPQQQPAIPARRRVTRS